MTGKRIHQRGFTLVETIMAIMIALMVVGAIWTAVVAGQRSSSGVEKKVSTTQDARSATDLMAMEIRMASHNRALAQATPWVDPDTCGAGIAAYRGIQRASSTGMTVEMDLSTDTLTVPVIGDADNEIIAYAYDAENRRVTRSMTRCNAGVPTVLTQTLLGPVNATVKTVNVINGAVPMFRYFNAAGTELVLDGHPEVIPQIRRIQIALVVESEESDPTTGQPRKLSYSTSVIPRNHGVVY
ncbi:MAG TPA: prepilin-type N-terminal cleavage/methylation domain-containing protein [Syntrophales bacterium]|nr:prepilin-type N-terminal cleavage/methylation domain-containing protein [Syntrophales bacterium]